MAFLCLRTRNQWLGLFELALFSIFFQTKKTNKKTKIVKNQTRNKNLEKQTNKKAVFWWKNDGRSLFIFFVLD